nr:ABC transporter substrate-binding protein [Palleronia sp. THAF1]
MKFLGGAAMALVLTGTAVAQDLPVLKASVLKFGTVNWELTTITENGFDTANGFDLDVNGVASGSAGEIAFQGGETDVIVSDWLWVARQRAAGRDYVFIPYSKAVGGVMVPEGSEAQTLADLAGGKIGIAGGPLDKSWLILQAYAQRELGFDLAGETEQVYGAPPLIYKTATGGDFAGAINYWHFMAKMEADGMRKIIDIADAAEAMGLDPETPLLGYVVKGEMLEQNPDLVNGLAAASRDAKDLLAGDDAAWEALRPKMNADTDAQFEALVAGFRAGIPAEGPVDEDAANTMLSLMAELGGEELVGEATSLPEGTFLQPGS